jgi:hypothetical protein
MTVLAALLIVLIVAGLLPEAGTWAQIAAEAVGEEVRVKPQVLAARLDLVVRVPEVAGMVFVRDWWVRLE